MTLRKLKNEPPFFSSLTGFAGKFSATGAGDPEGDFAWRVPMVSVGNCDFLGRELSGGSLGEGMGVDDESRGDVGTVDGVAAAEKPVEMVLIESRLLAAPAELVL